MISISLLYFSFYSCIVFLISLNFLSVFSCNSLSLFKTVILISLLDKDFYVFRISYWKIFGILWWFPCFLMFLEVLHCSVCIWSDSHLLLFLLTALPKIMWATFFFSYWYAETSLLDTWTSQWVFHSWWLSKILFSKGSRTMAESQFMGHSSAHSFDWEFCMFITQHVGGWNSSWVPWCMVLDPTAHTNAFLSRDGW